MQFELVTSEASFAGLETDWNRLAANRPLDRFEWRSAWWKAFGTGRRLAVGVARREDCIVAIAPCFVNKVPLRGNTLSMLGSGKACTDYQRIMVEPGLTDDESNAVAVQLFAFVAESASQITRLTGCELDGVHLGHSGSAAIAASLEAAGYVVERELLESAWVAELSDDWQTFVAGVGRGVRRKINKAQRRSEQPDIRYCEATDSAAVAKFWPEFVRLHQARFRDKVASGGCFADPAFERFLRSAIDGLAAVGAVRFVWIELLGKPISTQLYLLGDSTAYMYQSGFDPDYLPLEPGHLLYTHAIRHLIADGYRTLDFLRGDEPYKADWNAKPVALVRLHGVRPDMPARIRYQAWVSARRVRRALINAIRSPTCVKPRAKESSAALPSSVESRELPLPIEAVSP